MADLIKREDVFLVQKVTRNGTLTHTAPENLTKEQKAILTAYTAPNIATISDKDLLPKISGIIGRALVEMGHKRNLEDEADFKIMQDAIYTDIREKYEFFSISDLELVFKFGVRGDFKNKPDDVVFLNREQVNHWLKCYHRQKRAEVITQLKPAEAPKQKPEDYNPETDFETLVQKVKAGQEVPETEWICQTAQHYDRLNSSNAFNLNTQQRKAIYEEERRRQETEGKNRMLHVSTETRFLFRAFVDGQKGNNQYEKEVLTNCKIRVFREYVQQLAKHNAA